MKRVEGFAHLYVRDGRFLVRVQVPAAARHRVGRRELKSALGGDFVLAKKRYPAALARLRSQVDFPDVLPVSGSRHEPTSDEINQVAREFRARLRPDIARISRDAGGGEMSRLEQVDLLISIAVSGAAKGLPGQTSLQARWLFDEMGWHGSDDSPAFGDLCNKLLRARLDRLREEKHRIQALYTDRADADPLFAPVPAHAPANGGETVGHLIQLYRKDHEPSLAKSTAKNYRIALRALEELLGTDCLLQSLTRARCREIRDALVGLPANYRKLPLTRNLSILEAVEAGRRQGLATVRPSTVNGYITKLNAILQLAFDEGWISSNPATRLAVSDPVSPKQKRDPFSPAQLDEIFHGEPWSYNDRDVGERPARFWVPLLALYTGARVGELAQLATADITNRSGVDMIEIRAGDEPELKRKTLSVTCQYTQSWCA